MRILLPMVSDVDEFNRGRALIDRELERARLLNQTRPTQVLVGAMLEVPALAFMLPQLMRSADFVSIGSNDLLSLAFAVDRTNPRVARRYDNLNPASLTLIRLIVQSAAENSGDLSLCGEMAGRPLDAMALLGLGLRTSSMQPGQIGPIKSHDPQPQSARGRRFRGPALWPHRPVPAHQAGSFRGGTGHRAEMTSACRAKDGRRR